MKPFYKSWLLKFAKDCESRNDRSHSKRLVRQPITDSFNGLSTPLKNSSLHIILLGLLASSATLIIWQIDLSLRLRIALLVVVLLKAGQDMLNIFCEKNLANFVQLSVIEHKWCGLLKNQDTLALHLLGVSSVVGLGFVLKVKVKSSDKIHYLMVWNTRATPDFLRYCRQILKFGVPAE